MKRVFAAIIIILLGCGTTTLPYRAYLGSWGGKVDGPDKTYVTIPAKALTEQTEIYILENTGLSNLPANTLKVYMIGTTGIKLKAPAVFAVPSGLCKPAKWSLKGTEPWSDMPEEKNCPAGFTCADLTVLGSVACTKEDK